MHRLLASTGAQRRLHLRHAAIAAIVCLAAGTLCAIAHYSVAGVPRYALVDLGVWGPTGYPDDFPWASINQKGEVAGQIDVSRGDGHPTVFSRRSRRELACPGFDAGYVVALNDRGTAVGTALREGGDGAEYPAVWEHGKMRLLSTAQTDGFGGEVNSRGDIIWRESRSDGEEGYLLSNGVRTSLGAFLPTAINDRGQIACTGPHGRVYLWQNGRAVPITPAPLEDQHGFVEREYWPTAISGSGEVAGALATDNGMRAFVWKPGRGLSLLPLSANLLRADTPPVAMATGINSRGDIVGREMPGERGTNGFLFSNNVVRDLNALLDAAPHWHVSAACSINDAGQIAAIADYRGQPHIVLLTPEPAIPFLPSLAARFRPA